jgi:UDP-N-acetylmuramoyl-L-alanyl-D-glutamate--2,6-diaminopimelate ligase
MKFLELLSGGAAGGASIAESVTNVYDPQGDPEIYGIEYDSRRIRPGYLFVAIRGDRTDGNRYIDAAVENGAVAVVTDSGEVPAREGIAWARVEDGRRALALLSARLLDHPAQKLQISGITGTNGKTTTSYLLEAILNAAGHRTVLVGTIEYHVPGQVLDAPHTTPESLDLNRIFHKGVREGATEAVMELSSHALAQARVYGMQYDVAVFTNLTRDHLDYHHNFEQYFAAKRRLFEGIGAPPPRAAVINAEDEWGQKLAEFARSRGSEVLEYGVERGGFRALEVDLRTDGTTFDLLTPVGRIQLGSPLIGHVNVQNILAAAAAAYARGCSLQQIREGVLRLDRVPGRFERVDCGQPFTVVVDYAHTDDALKNLTRVAREFVNRGGAGRRVITLFGCGGDRDRSKRPRMGLAAGQGSDFVVITSDNPRSEDPIAIIEEARPGVEQSGVAFAVEPERRKAIAVAISEAREGDIVLLAGKGHEKVQISRSGTIPFDDVEVARQVLQAAGYQARPQLAEQGV